MEYKNKNQVKTLKEFIALSLDDVHPKLDGKYPGIDEAINLFLSWVTKKKKIAVFGDYDVDGDGALAIATLLMRSLRLTAEIVSPGRFSNGYGITTKAIEDLHQKGINALITVDNGIAALEPLKLAKEYGMEIIVLDHHEPVIKDGEVILPEVDVLVDPHVTGGRNGFDDLCGAGLMYFFATGVLKRVGILDETTREKMIVFAALSTVADVVKLQSDNRAIVTEGLRLIREDKMTEGLRELIRGVGIDLSTFDEGTIGYSIGPCLNASGRLSDKGPEKMVQLLTCETASEATSSLVEKAILCNEKRKEIVADMLNMANMYLLATDDDNSRFLVYHHQGAKHEGVAGIAAAQLAEKYHKPCIVLCGSGTVKGSGRTFLTADVLGSLRKVDQDLLISYGGHPEACGVKLLESNIPAFRAAMQKVTPKVDMPEELLYDFDIEADAAEAFATEQQEYAPFGAGNPKPLVRMKLHVVKVFFMGDAKQHVKFLTKEGVSVLQFDGAKALKGKKLEWIKTVDAVGTLGFNTYMGKTTLQLEAKSFAVK